MSLNQLYDWFECHVDDGVPWVKSSIRHTLCVHQAFIKSQSGRSNWRLSSNLQHSVKSMSPPHKSVTPSFHTEFSSKPGRHETTFDDHWLGVPLESIPELDGTSAFALHTSMATVDEQSVVDNPGTDFQLPPSVVCFSCLLSSDSQCDGQSPSCNQCLRLGLTCEERRPSFSGRQNVPQGSS
ncbi:hypothetical protein CABS01_16873 [Colletotrichum abscissum]|uniref:uncharacterized protein n=1 Tax=Colletotrichum abscissum TaxID=1671311 RepID=UPI0027D4E0BF|nr:uncharacterized protein CABS01_16873 [Colletotrichum abscissum]KAK1508132.1 hypothetical protein CABS01_16873 [Colletotrichum abscissum]